MHMIFSLGVYKKQTIDVFSHMGVSPSLPLSKKALKKCLRLRIKKKKDYHLLLRVSTAKVRCDYPGHVTGELCGLPTPWQRC